MKDSENTYEVSANDFIEQQTKQIEKEFKSSRPNPRNWAMGFRGEPKPKHKQPSTEKAN